MMDLNTDTAGHIVCELSNPPTSHSGLTLDTSRQSLGVKVLRPSLSFFLVPAPVAPKLLQAF